MAVIKPVTNSDKQALMIQAVLGFLPEYLAIAAPVATLVLKIAHKLLKSSSVFCFLNRFFIIVCFKIIRQKYISIMPTNVSEKINSEYK
jgi:hypothetical protein